jgi:hypothetical protein
MGISRRYRSIFIAALLLALSMPPASFGQGFKKFDTRFTEIYYENDDDMREFLWRISGREVDVYTYPGFAKSNIDRIVEKVQSLLDMYPEEFKVAIYLRPRYDKGHIAFYSEDANSITAYADRVTQNVIAHEISHAVIYDYFPVPPPKKAQEILSQYVDRHLWNGGR